MTKKSYIEPSVKINRFLTQNIVTTSGGPYASQDEAKTAAKSWLGSKSVNVAENSYILTF